VPLFSANIAMLIGIMYALRKRTKKQILKEEA